MSQEMVIAKDPFPTVDNPQPENSLAEIEMEREKQEFEAAFMKRCGKF